jgi:hypothetical protein
LISGGISLLVPIIFGIWRDIKNKK